MTTILSGAGTIIRIGTTQSDFANDIYTDIGEVSSIGKFGEEYEVMTHQSLSEKYVSKMKGNYNPGTLEVRVAFNTNDDGQKNWKTL